MASNNNIFYATNPARISDALWRVMSDSGVALADMLIFLPSRRAVRGFEKFLVQQHGHSIILPRLVALGEGTGDEDGQDAENPDAVSDTMRIVTAAHLLAADGSIGNIVTALPIARDLIRVQDYLENEGIDATKIDWAGLVDEKYAAHFQRKAKLFAILSDVQNAINDNRMTQVQVRNRDIRAWIDKLHEYKLVIVCASTASVPATADLMAHVADIPHGRIILSGHIRGVPDDFLLNTNPYCSEYKFLTRIGVRPDEVLPIDVGPSAIEFMNYAFSNQFDVYGDGADIQHCHRIDCARESEEAIVVAEITARAVAKNKTVLVITPDAAGNQRIGAALASRGVVADFSGGISGAMTRPGRAILNAFDDWIDCGNTSGFDKLYTESGHDLSEMIIRMVDDKLVDFSPSFDVSDAESLAVFGAIKKMSDCLNSRKICLNLSDARAFVADAISGVTIRGEMSDDVSVAVLGTIESRMQTADVVILTGLNEGMFPARGYENAWLPRDLSEQIGLPSPDRKVSLQALDFMNLSCGSDVYWTRSRVSGGTQTTESRFLSRVTVRGGQYDTNYESEILSVVRDADDVPMQPLDYSAPCPPPDWSDVYVTELEKLIHNPYVFYVQHILRLRVLDDYWIGPDARVFGNLVHDAIKDMRDYNPENLVAQLDARATQILGPDSVLFHFWHKRFVEMAPAVVSTFSKLENSASEIGGMVNIDGRTIRARADCVWDGGVLDIKTGTPPTKKQLHDGTMPQLPLEAYMLQSGGFPIRTTEKSRAPEMVFLQLKNNDVCTVIYDAAQTQEMINAAVEKTKHLIDMYSVGGAAYEYLETGDRKYKLCDDLARCDD